MKKTIYYCDSCELEKNSLDLYDITIKINRGKYSSNMEFYLICEDCIGEEIGMEKTTYRPLFFNKGRDFLRKFGVIK